MTIPMPEQKPPRLTAGRFPGYDVLSKRLTPSWNEKTREVVTRRLAIDPEPKFFTTEEFQTVRAIADRVVPQPATRPPIPVAALVDEKLHQHKEDGYRKAGMPREAEAWRRGLKALDEDAKQANGARFKDLSDADKDALLTRMEQGALTGPAWGGMSSSTFFKMRMARDIVHAYYAHPTAWSEIGWGGPASPRGYVRMDFNERDPWEAAEVKGGDVGSARRKNRHVG
jgi:Gluconate 2-dehydrogenase subunit 3